MTVQPSDISIQVPDTEEGHKLKEALVVTLYTEGAYTQSQAAEMLDITIREFHDLLIKRGIPISGFDDEEVLEMFSGRVRTFEP